MRRLVSITSVENGPTGSYLDLLGQPSWSPDGESGNKASPALSPDGTKLAFTTLSDGVVEIVIADLSASELENVRTLRNAAMATWSPRGAEIVFTQLRGKRYFDLYSLDLEEGRPNRLTRSPGQDSWPTWSPDGNMIAFMRDVDFAKGSYQSSDIHVLELISGNITNLTQDVDMNVTMQPARRPDPVVTTDSAVGRLRASK